MYDELIERFEQLRSRRFENVNVLLNTTDDLDDLLADIANIATALYISRRIRQVPQGFVSNDRRKAN